MKNVLIICGHADYAHSFSNRTIMEELGKKLPSAEQRVLADLYPDGKIDVEKEQQELLKADIIVFQFPLNWYAFPYLLKAYFDLVFLYNFAYGRERKLDGKKLVMSLTTGAPEVDYTHEGSLKTTIEEFLTPQKASANLCALEFCKPVCSYDMTYIPGIMDDARKEDVRLRSVAHAERLLETLKNL